MTPSGTWNPALRPTSIALLLLVLAALGLGGCSKPMLSGVVIEGTAPGVLVLPLEDPRFKQIGLEGASLEFSLDPTGMAPKPLGSTITSVQGAFVMPVEEFGVGFLEYELGVTCRAPGYQDVWTTLPMPKAKQGLLIIMAPGRGGNAPRDVLRDTLKMNDELMNAQ